MNPNITKIIDQYLSGELTGDDLKGFEERLEKYPDLKAEVALQKTIQEGSKRASQRATIKKVAKRYHLFKRLKWTGISMVVVGIIAAAVFFIMVNQDADHFEIDDETIEQLNEELQIDNLKSQYFAIPKEGRVVLSENGVLVSVPSGAFLKDGKPFVGNTILQYQEAMDASSILKSGLNTMSGDRMLETQGMFTFKGYTQSGEPLDFNPKTGVYVQVPVNEQRSDMQLFDGVQLADGSIDWQSPEEFKKIPVSVSMDQLNFYPEGYEDFLNDQKWQQKKESRDSLYLSFEEFQYGEWASYRTAFPIVPRRKITVEERDYIYNDRRPIDSYMSMDEAMILSNWEEGPNYTEFQDFRNYYETYESVEISDTTIEHAVSEAAEAEDVACFNRISPSKVLGFWNKKFNNTILATREFERRMRAIHSTCDDRVLETYTNGLSRSIGDIDRQVVAMGYDSFKGFASENVGAVNPNNPHFKNLQAFYDKGIQQLKDRNKRLQKKEKRRQQKWDQKMFKEREKEQQRKINRDSRALKEEFAYNLNNVYKQLGYTKSFTVTSSSKSATTTPRRSMPAIKNIDAYVMEATVNRESTEITDSHGNTATITYNDFSFNVPNSSKYQQLFTYIFPHELESFQRIEGKNGKFNYPLNDDMLYDFAVVGITSEGYEYFQKQTLKGGQLGTIQLEKLTEIDLNLSIKQLNNKRNPKPMRIQEELDWLINERKDYQEQAMRREMSIFREEIARTIFPCYMPLNRQAQYKPMEAEREPISQENHEEVESNNVKNNFSMQSSLPSQH